MNAVLIAESEPGQEKRLRQVIENLDYWTHIVRCYGKFSGYYTIFAFPAEYSRELEDYLDEATQLQAFSRYVFHRTTNFIESAPSFDWFDFQKKSWNFQWKAWIREVMESTRRLPQGLKDILPSLAKIDLIDIFILKELEKDGSVRFIELSDGLNVDRHEISRKWSRIVTHELLADYEVAFLPYSLLTSEMSIFIIEFENEIALARFSSTLFNKPFIMNFARVFDEDSLIVHTYIPKRSFPAFVDSLNQLIEKNVVKRFSHVTLNAGSSTRQTISYEFFSNDGWFYNQRRKIERLKELSK